MTTPTEIKLVGTLGKRYGRSHQVHLDTKCTAEAMRWILANFPGARDYFATAHQKGLTFAVFRGRGQHKENIGRDQLNEPAGDCITIAPVLMGSKSGLLQTVLGVALIVAGAAISASSWGLAAPVGGAVTSLGIGMVAGGIVQMLSPQAKLQKNADSADNQASYVFNGPVNTTAQGNPVPVVYGRMIVGSAVISAGMEADDYSPATNGVGAGTAGGSGLKTPYDEVP
ncbi:tail assembly protein [Dyella jiangningensis]|uniref:tail assembly protein n=1 Tax=Dyella jiangningensis TaxID=1379159 RepID=UPI0017847E2D|nr:tail assembly protein [Dyella jiangningensis]